MAKHKDQDKKDQGGTPGYEPKHAGGWDAYDWAAYGNATADTQQIPAVKDKEKK